MSKVVSTVVEKKKNASVKHDSKREIGDFEYITFKNDRYHEARKQMLIPDDEKEYGLGCNNCYACVSGGSYPCEFETE